MVKTTTIPTSEARTTAPLPLAGVRVVDLTRAWAGPSCTAFLGELGADVIKVEAPEGESLRGGLRSAARGETPRPFNASATFNIINRNKRGMAVDLSAPEGREVMLRLVAESDCVVENFRPGVIERLGLGFESLREVNPRIVLASNGGYGHAGPYAGYRGYGVAIEPMSGLFSVTGYEGDRPQRSGVDHPDPQAGLSMATALLIAIFVARRTGRGRHVKTSLLRAMAACFAPRVIEHLALGTAPTRHGNESDRLFPHGVYRCAGEDQWVALAVVDDGQWDALCEIVGRPDLARDERMRTAEGRRAQRNLVDEAITAWTAIRPKREAEAALQQRGVTAAAVQSVADLLADEQLESRQFFRTIDHADWGAHAHIGSRVQLDGKRPPVRPAPMFAEHTDEILGGLLDLPPEEIDRLDERHIVPREPWRAER